MLEDKALRIQHTAFKKWLKICIDIALKEEKELNHKATIKRYIYLYIF